MISNVPTTTQPGGFRSTRGPKLGHKDSSERLAETEAQSGPGTGIQLGPGLSENLDSTLSLLGPLSHLHLTGGFRRSLGALSHHFLGAQERGQDLGRKNPNRELRVVLLIYWRKVLRSRPGAAARVGNSGNHQEHPRKQSPAPPLHSNH